MSWIYLCKDDWAAHRLNRFRGGLLAVLIWVGLQFIFALAVALGLGFGGTDWLFREGVPDPYEWLIWGAMIAGPFVILPALLGRHAWVPILFALYIALTFLLLLGAEFYAPDWFSAARYQTMDGTIAAAIFAAAVSIDLVVIRYLFRGIRPNVMFQRRIRA